MLNNSHTEIIPFLRRFQRFNTERSRVKGAGIFFFVNRFSSLIWVQSDEWAYIQLIERPSSSSDSR